MGNVQNEFLRARKDFLDLQRYRRIRFEKSKDIIDGAPFDSLQIQKAFSGAGTITCVGATDQQCIRQSDEWQNQSLQFNVAGSHVTNKIAPLSFYEASTLGTDPCPDLRNRKSDTSPANLWTRTFINQRRKPLNPKELNISPKSSSSCVSLGHNEFLEHGERLNSQNFDGIGRRTTFEDLSITADDTLGIHHHILSDNHTEYMGCAEKIGQHLVSVSNFLELDLSQDTLHYNVKVFDSL